MMGKGWRKLGVPDRWTKYSPFKEPIPNTRFIAFKVPLSESLVRPEPCGFRFTPAAMLEKFRNRNIDVGLIVDLTNTDRYYGQGAFSVFRNYDVAYYKLPTRGQQIPSRKVVDDFYSVVDDFFASDAKRLVGVHCTHGLNRTGYLICRYLVEKQKWRPEDAIREFDRARGHEQERQPYLDDLRKLGSAFGRSAPFETDRTAVDPPSASASWQEETQTLDRPQTVSSELHSHADEETTRDRRSSNKAKLVNEDETWRSECGEQSSASWRRRSPGSDPYSNRPSGSFFQGHDRGSQQQPSQPTWRIPFCSDESWQPRQPQPYSSEEMSRGPQSYQWYRNNYNAHRLKQRPSFQPYERLSAPRSQNGSDRRSRGRNDRDNEDRSPCRWRRDGGGW